jgi:hypothetical protein
MDYLTELLIGCLENTVIVGSLWHCVHMKKILHKYRSSQRCYLLLIEKLHDYHE